MKVYFTFTNFTRGVFPLIILSLLAGLTACQRKTPEQETGQAATQAAETTTETASSFPVKFKHVYGETTIKSEPKRIVSLSYGRAGTLWALGVKPIAVRYSYGDYEYAAFPWAQEALGDSKPFVIKGELDFEKIAELQPDLILGLWSGMKKEDYEILTKIAPTIPHGFDKDDKEYRNYGTPWDVMTLTVGRAVGKYDEAKAAVDGINEKIAEIAKDHPEWKGKTSTVGFYWKDKPGAYADTDIRPRLINQMGFVTNPEIVNATKPGSFTVSLSKEQISKLDADVLFWVISNQESLDNIKNLEGRKLMKTYKEGREILVDELLTGAFSYATVLSLPFALDSLVPLIESAVDGDPSTVVKSSRERGLLD